MQFYHISSNDYKKVSIIEEIYMIEKYPSKEDIISEHYEWD